MRCIFSALLMTLLMLAAVVVFGDSESGPLPYATTSSDGTFIFVMLAPGETQVDGIPLVQSHQISQYLTAKYPKSGLYLNDGSTTPLWTVDWYAFSVLVPSDGVHLIRLGPWARRLSDEAITFFAKDKVLRSYKIHDLVDIKAPLRQSVSHFEWAESMKVHDETHTLHVATISKERYAFDYASGEIVTSRRPLRGVLVVVIAVFIFIMAWRLRRRRKCAESAV
jgi:hypothetical protein